MSIAETMHAMGPLQTNDGTLHARQEPGAEQNGQRYPDRKMDPGWWLHRFFEREQTAEQNMAGDKHGDVGRCIVGTMVMPLRPAMAALIPDRQEACKQVRLTTGRATFGKADPHGPPPIAVALLVWLEPGRRRTIVGIKIALVDRNRHVLSLSGPLATPAAITSSATKPRCPAASIPFGQCQLHFVGLAQNFEAQSASNRDRFKQLDRYSVAEPVAAM